MRAAHPKVQWSGAVDDVQHLEHLFLARACLAKDPAALQWFESEVLPAVRPTLLRVNASATFVDDALQAVRARLFVGPPPGLAKYSGKGPVQAWARAVAYGIGVDLVEAGRRPDSASEDEAAIDLNAASEGADIRLLKARHQRDFSAALKQAMASLSDRDRTVLRMRFADGLAREEIGAFFNVHRTTAMRWLDAAQAALLERTRAALAERLKLPPAELDSLIRYLHSGVGPSLLGRGS